VIDTLVTLGAILLVIGFHEYGHYSALKKFGVTCPDFSIGIGPRLFGIHRNGTTFNIRIIPIGGFVSLPKGWADRITKWQKVRVLFAGPWANVVTAIPFGILLALQVEKFSEYHWLIIVATVTIGTPLLFLLSIPLTIYAVLTAFISPGGFVEDSQGVIGAVWEGRAEGSTVWEHFLTTIYFFSIGVASFNLLPLSFLDGGQIYATLLARYEGFLKYWRVVSTVGLIALIILINGGDILQALGWW
jgi:membrane-associated protease RseP (regulator of RpoE activity)